jgi:hypothetical protein
MSNVGDWIILLAVVVGLVSTTMETIVKPFVQELIAKLPNGDLFKSGVAYGYLIRLLVFAVAIIEMQPFTEHLNIFETLGGYDVPDLVVVVICGFTVTFFSKQIHDFAAVMKIYLGDKIERE